MKGRDVNTCCRGAGQNVIVIDVWGRDRCVSTNRAAVIRARLLATTSTVLARTRVAVREVLC